MSDDVEEPGQAPLGNLLAWVLLAALMGGIGWFIYQATRPQKWATQPEPKANLKSAYTAQRAHFQEKDTYDMRADRIGFGPERGNRYTYFLADSGPVEFRDMSEDRPVEGAVIIGADRHRHPGAPRFHSFRETGCPLTPCAAPDGTALTAPGVANDTADTGRSVFLVAAAGNIDEDDALDCWSICPHDRKAADGRSIPRGEPFLERSDL